MAGKRPHRILRPALLELRAAARKYEYEREGLGERFARAIDEAVQDVIAHPIRWPLLASVPSELRVRHRMVADFPFQILYRVAAVVSAGVTGASWPRSGLSTRGPCGKLST